MAVNSATLPLVLRETDDRIVTLTLNRPQKLNALSPALFAELRAHLEVLATDETVSCVVLTGAGASFSAGHDMKAMTGDLEEERLNAEAIDLLESLPVPTIAKIRGHCLTGGLELVLGCDLIYAAESTRIGDTHGKWGFVPVWGMSVRLPERVGRSRAKELMFTSRVLSGKEAAQIGLVDRCVTDAELDATVAALASEIAANSRGTNCIDKALLAATVGMRREDALLFERLLPFGRVKDRAERMTAAARFTGGEK